MEVENYKKNKNDFLYNEVDNPLYEYYTQTQSTSINAIYSIFGVRLDSGKWKIGDSLLKLYLDDIKVHLVLLN